MTFDFLSFTFQPRAARRRDGAAFLSFLPAISGTAAREIWQQIREWHVRPRPTSIGATWRNSPMRWSVGGGPTSASSIGRRVGVSFGHSTGRLGGTHQCGGPWVVDLLRPVLSVGVSACPSVTQPGARSLGATEVQTVSSVASPLLPGAFGLEQCGPPAHAPVVRGVWQLRGEAGGWKVKAGWGESLTSGSVRAEGCDSPPLLDRLVPFV